MMIFIGFFCHIKNKLRAKLIYNYKVTKNISNTQYHYVKYTT